VQRIVFICVPHRGSELAVNWVGSLGDFIPKVKVEVVIADQKVDSAISAIVMTAKTGKIGDGKIFISEVQEAFRIRTNETGENAI
jgi:nitrogen regulatory protein P-II 1